MSKVHFEIFKTKNKQFAFRIVHANGNKLTSSETYTRKANAMKAAKNMLYVISWEEIDVNDLTKKK